MKIRIPIMAILFVFLSSFAVQAEESLEDIRTRMKKRYSILKELKAKGKIGETQQGWIEAVHEENAKDKAIKTIIDDENSDREKLYKIIAKRTDTTPKAVGEQNALRILKKAGPEELFKGKDDKWRPKKKMMTDKPKK